MMKNEGSLKHIQCFSSYSFATTVNKSKKEAAVLDSYILVPSIPTTAAAEVTLLLSHHSHERLQDFQGSAGLVGTSGSKLSHRQRP